MGGTGLGQAVSHKGGKVSLMSLRSSSVFLPVLFEPESQRASRLPHHSLRKTSQTLSCCIFEGKQGRLVRKASGEASRLWAAMQRSRYQFVLPIRFW